VYGIAGQSVKKSIYGVIGGIIGAGIGGLAFDPICIYRNRCAQSLHRLNDYGRKHRRRYWSRGKRLKDRWLYVSSGPLAGKQFILYKAQTRIGRDQSNDIYLFKDVAVQPQHAVIELRAGRAVLIAATPTLISGQSVTERTLQNGDLIQIGRYSFSYQEKQRSV
jgi:hypothetical protein